MKTVTITLAGNVPDRFARRLKEKGIYIKPVEFLVNVSKDSYSKAIVFKPVSAKVGETE